LDYCNKVSYLEWFINNRNLFGTVLEAEKSKINDKQCFVSGKDPLPVSEMATFYWVLAQDPVERDGKSLSGLFFKGANPIHEGTTFITQSLPNTILLGLRI
jgi:hypothetical protein